MTTVNSPAAYTPEISADEGKFFIDWEKKLNALTLPTGEGADKKAAVFSDAEVTKFTDSLGEKLKAKFFNASDLAFVAQSFDNELASGKPNFATLEKRLDLFGSSAPVVPKPEANTGSSTNVEVTVNVGGPRTTGSTTSNTKPSLSGLSADIYGALKSMDDVNSSLQRSIRNGDINKYSIGTMEMPGAWTKVAIRNVGARGILVGNEISQSQMNKGVIEALNKMLNDYQEELDEAKDT
ncbi:MAG: hypothetical protein HEQ39_13410 [Rhizobacter sp.]